MLLSAVFVELLYFLIGTWHIYIYGPGRDECTPKFVLSGWCVMSQTSF